MGGVTFCPLSGLRKVRYVSRKIGKYVSLVEVSEFIGRHSETFLEKLAEIVYGIKAHLIGNECD